MFLKYNLISSTCFKLGYILCFESFFASITTFLLQLMDLIRCFKQNDFGNILFLIQLSKKINWFFATWSQHSNYKTSLIKPAIPTLLTKKYRIIMNPYEISDQTCAYEKKNLPFMNIITSTESCALDIHQPNLVHLIWNIIMKKMKQKL